MKPDKRSAWLRKLDEECPYQVVMPRRQLTDDSAILDFLLAHVGKFDMYIEDDYAAFERVFKAIAHERRIIVFDIHVELADMGEQKIQDRVVVGQLPPRQHHLIRAFFIKLTQPSTSFVRFHDCPP